jgi:hypothetical protein
MAPTLAEIVADWFEDNKETHNLSYWHVVGNKIKRRSFDNSYYIPFIIQHDRVRIRSNYGEILASDPDFFNNLLNIIQEKETYYHGH